MTAFFSLLTLTVKASLWKTAFEFLRTKLSWLGYALSIEDLFVATSSQYVYSFGLESQRRMKKTGNGQEKVHHTYTQTI